MFDWDVIIIGGGPAGLTAGMYLSRANFRTLLIEGENFGGKIKNVEWIENYPGFPDGISGAQLSNAMEAQAKKYGLVTQMQTVSSIELFSESRWVNCSDGKGYTTDIIIIAGGSHHRKLNIPGETELAGHGVFYCAFCDGGQFINRPVIVCGGGDSGVTEALYMSKIASHVTILEAMPRLTATPILQDRVASNPKVTIRTGVTAERIIGEKQVERIQISENCSGKSEILEAEGILVQIGFTANTDYLKGLIPLDKSGQIVVNDNLEAGFPYMLAAGDIRGSSRCQIGSAVGDGVAAGMSAIHYLQKKIQ